MVRVTRAELIAPLAYIDIEELSEGAPARLTYAFRTEAPTPQHPRTHVTLVDVTETETGRAVHRRLGSTAARRAARRVLLSA